MLPIVNGLEAEFAGAAAVVRLNADDPGVAALREQYGVRGHPTFIVIDRQNRILERFVGPQESAKLRSALATAVD